MTDRFEKFEALSSQARAEVPPAVDVRDEVLRRIRQERRQGSGDLVIDRPTIAFAAAAALAAILVGGAAFWGGSADTDPLATLFDPVTMVMR